MCWIGNLSDRRIANRDKVVYKVFIKSREGEFKSALRAMLYKRNTLYVSKFGISMISMTVPDAYAVIDSDITISEGFHSYETYTDALSLVECMHSNDAVIVECIIPKGSVYFTRIGAIVSNKIIIPNQDVLDRKSK